MAKWALPNPYLAGGHLKDVDIEELISDSQLLACLMEMRVDLWEGYDEAYEMFEKSKEMKG